MKTVIFNELSFLVDSIVSDFSICYKESSNVQFFGFNLAENKMFFQFKSGSYIFSGVPKEIITAALNYDSIGTFFASKIRNKFLSEKIDAPLVKLQPDSEKGKYSSEVYHDGMREAEQTLLEDDPISNDRSDEDYEPEYPLPSDFLRGDKLEDYND